MATTTDGTKIVIDDSEMHVMSAGKYPRNFEIYGIITTKLNLIAANNIDDVTDAGVDATDNTCNNCTPQGINIKEELSLSSVSDDDVGPSITLEKKSTGMNSRGK